ncbi:MAG TPA: hypothetical protein VLV81_07410 [Acidimicrobiia bacterium]|nr:hypothetical protein [Acidimicrobiia bacterium]
MPTTDDVLAILDEDGEELVLDVDEATRLLAMTHDFDGATVSACPRCRSRVIAAVAVADLLSDAIDPSARDLAELAEEAPTLHLYVQDLATSCRHPAWHDPGHAEWLEVLDELADVRRPLS